MTIPGVEVLWQQLDGPQVRGLINGTRAWFKSWVEPKLTYYDNLSLATCNDAHLTMLGKLMGVARPTMISSAYANNFFRFSRDRQHNVNYGFGNLPSLWPPIQGGYFSWTDPDYPELYVPMPIETYRTLLMTISKSEGEIGSLVMLQDLLFAFCGTKWTIEPLDPTDIEYYIGDWKVMLTENNIFAWTIMLSLADGLLGPMPHLVIDMVD